MATKQALVGRTEGHRPASVILACHSLQHTCLQPPRPRILQHRPQRLTALQHPAPTSTTLAHAPATTRSFSSTRLTMQKASCSERSISSSM